MRTLQQVRAERKALEQDHQNIISELRCIADEMKNLMLRNLTPEQLRKALGAYRARGLAVQDGLGKLMQRAHDLDVEELGIRAEEEIASVEIIMDAMRSGRMGAC